MAGKNGSNPPFRVPDFFATTETMTFYPYGAETRVWIRFKRELSYGEQNELDNAATDGYSVREIKAKLNQSEIRVHSDIKRHRLLKLALYIDDWNYPGPDGQTLRWPRKLDEKVALIDKMNDELGKLLSNEVDRLIGEQTTAREAEGYPLTTDETAEVDEKPNPSRLRAIEGQAR
jgi:hypothetical protein